LDFPVGAEFVETGGESKHYEHIFTKWHNEADFGVENVTSNVMTIWGGIAIIRTVPTKPNPNESPSNPDFMSLRSPLGQGRQERQKSKNFSAQSKTEQRQTKNRKS